MPVGRVTLADVAEVAGVSGATVSRSLRNDRQISQATRERIQRVADQLGYVPNLTARSLASARTQILGLMIPDVTDPVHGQIVVGFERAAADHGYTVLLANIGASGPQESQALRIFVSNQTDGVAVFGGVLAQKDVLGASGGRPVVFISTENLAGYHGDLPVGCIRSDDEAGVTDAVRHAVKVGHRRFAYVNGWNVASNLKRRNAATRAVAETDGVLPLRQWSLDETEGITKVARKMVGAGIDIALCYDDKMALRLLDALRDLDVNVPRDMGVIGFDDIPFAAISSPRLTTVAVPYATMGAMAVGMVIERLKTGELPASMTVPANLVVRETTRTQVA